MSVVVHSADDVELRKGVWSPTSFLFTDRSHSGRLSAIVSGLDGTIDVGALAAREGVLRQEVEALVDRLFDAGLVEDTPSSALDALLATTAPWRPQAPELERILVYGDEVAGALRSLLGDTLGGVPIEQLAPDDPVTEVIADVDTAWLDDGLAREERLEVFRRWRGALVIAAGPSINPIALRTINRACLRHEVTWIHAALDGPFCLVGPSFVPPEGSCYECLEARVFCSFRDGASYQRYKRALANASVKMNAVPLQRPLIGLLAAHLALEVANLALTGWTFTVGRMLAIHLPTMEITFPEVLRVPGCEGCGSDVQVQGQTLYYEAALTPAEIS